MRGVSIGFIDPSQIGFDSHGRLKLDIIWNIFKLKSTLHFGLLGKLGVMYCAPEIGSSTLVQSLQETSGNILEGEFKAKEDSGVQIVSDWWTVGVIL